MSVLLLGVMVGCGSRTPFYEPRDAGGDVFAPDVFAPDVFAPDVPPACPSPLTLCRGRCVNLQSDSINCGACGLACGDSSCVGGVCRTTTCPRPTTLCGVRCIDLSTDRTSCGACGRVCAVGQSCVAGACVSPPPLTGTAFRIASLGAGGCFAVEHSSVTGDDRGGIAMSSDGLFYTGDTTTGRFDAEMLGGSPVGRQYDALASNLRDGRVYVLANETTPLTGTGGVLSSLAFIDGPTGALTGTALRLSMPITLTTSSNLGIFSGYDRIAIFANSRVYNIDLPSGRVTDLGAMATPAHQTCETWAYWGVAEFFGGSLYLTFVQNSRAVVRTRVPDGTTFRVADFTNLSDMCSFTVSPTRGRWYWHHEGSSQFRTGDESIGYCTATFDSGGTPVMYTVSDPPRDVTWIDACAMPARTTLLARVDDAASIVSLPFAFRYWDRALPMGSPINVTSNGWLGLDGMMSNSLGGSISQPTNPNAVLAVHWGDDYTRSDGVCLATVGVAPARRWVVEWSDTHYCCSDDPAIHLTYEAILNEGSDTIDFLYNDMRGARPQTVGIENFEGSSGVAVCTTGMACAVTTGSRYRFTPSR